MELHLRGTLLPDRAPVELWTDNGRMSLRPVVGAQTIATEGFILPGLDDGAPGHGEPPTTHAAGPWRQARCRTGHEEDGTMGQEELAATRRSLHGVAELVLAGPQYRATGKLRLRVVPGGFATVEPPELRADPASVVAAGGVAVAIDGRTPRAIGAELGVTAGRPAGAYDGGSGVDPDETLHPDTETVRP